MRPMASERRFTVTSPLGPDVLMLKSMNGHEALGRPFRYEVELLSEQAGIDPDGLVGQPMTINATLQDGSVRHFSGIVTAFGRREGPRAPLVRLDDFRDRETRRSMVVPKRRSERPSSWDRPSYLRVVK